MQWRYVRGGLVKPNLLLTALWCLYAGFGGVAVANTVEQIPWYRHALKALGQYPMEKVDGDRGMYT